MESVKTISSSVEMNKYKLLNFNKTSNFGVIQDFVSIHKKLTMIF